MFKTWGLKGEVVSIFVRISCLVDVAYMKGMGDEYIKGLNMDRIPKCAN